MTETPVSIKPELCHKTRTCPGPMATAQSNYTKPITPCLGPNASGRILESWSGHSSTKSPTQDGGGNAACRPPGDPKEGCKRKCGCMRTSDKLKQILQTFPNPEPLGCRQAYAPKKDKAIGYSYGHKEACCANKPKDLDRSESAGGKDLSCCRSDSQQSNTNKKMDSCYRCMTQYRKIHQGSAEGARSHHGSSEGGRIHYGSAERGVSIYKQQQQLAEAKASSRSWQIMSDLVSLVQLSVTATALALYYLIYCYMQLVYYTLRSALYFHNADGPMKITIGVVTLTSLIIGFNILMRMEGIIGIVY